VGSRCSAIWFASFSETAQNLQFTPPANCSGPLRRTAGIYVANANINFGTTPEPLKNATHTWHLERDVTDYSVISDWDGARLMKKSFPAQFSILPHREAECNLLGDLQS